MRIEYKYLQITLRQAFAEAKQSPDPWVKVGAIALNEGGAIMAVGYNHAGVHALGEDHPIWVNREERRKFMIHAEVSMVNNLRGREPHAVVVTIHPCVHCMTLLAAIGTKEIYYNQTDSRSRDSAIVAAHYGIKCERIDL